MQHQHTTISETMIGMRFANHSDPAKATEWLDFQVPLSELKVPDLDVDRTLGDPESQHLATLRKAALHYARSVINAETQRLANRRGRSV